MNLHRALLVSVSVLAANSALADCRHSATRSAEIGAEGVRRLIVSAAAGDLVVVGEANARQVRVTGEACASTAEALDGVQLETRRDGDTVHVQTTTPNGRSFMNHTSLDLKLSVPASIALELRDSSGDIVVRSVASAQIADSSGDQTIRDVAGDVSVDDSSGEVEIETVRGNVVVRDSSGEVEISDVAGNVSIPVDSSGSLGLRRIRGDVHIGSDSSGDIVLAEINRDVRIEHDSSGDIRASDIGGSLTVENDTSGGISHRNVLGQVSIPKSQ